LALLLTLPLSAADPLYGVWTSKTTLSADGKTMTIDGMMGPIASHLVFYRVK
jgi:hypothetical protein